MDKEKKMIHFPKQRKVIHTLTVELAEYSDGRYISVGGATSVERALAVGMLETAKHMILHEEVDNGKV